MGAWFLFISFDFCMLKAWSVLQDLHPSSATRSGDGSQGGRVKLAASQGKRQAFHPKLESFSKTFYWITLSPQTLPVSCFALHQAKPKNVCLPCQEGAFFSSIYSLAPSNEELQFTAAPHLFSVSHLAHVFPSQRLPSRLLAPDAAVLLLQVCSKTHYYQKETHYCPSLWWRFEGFPSLSSAPNAGIPFRPQSLARKIK
jgi:hypothetical protein